MWAVPYREFKTFPKEGCSQSSVGVELKGGSAPLVKIIVVVVIRYIVWVVWPYALACAFNF